MRTLIAALIALTSLPVLADPCSQLPVLFVVQDKSGSMNSFGPNGQASSPTNPSKWSIARTVVPALAQQFSNRFRFGAEMFPTATTQFNCSAPTVMAEVSTLPDGVVSAYGTAVSGGATPTAAALTLAKTHLQGLHLTTPTYVLLITDGLPNCDTSLNVNTCVSSNGCDPVTNFHCGVGVIDCLDDVATTQAAAALAAAGIKVFVVGFGSDTAGNNKTVLDAMAAAGGTGSAYSAMNQTELTNVLNTIALNTTTCCNDACASGTQCTAGGQLQTCTYDPSTKCKGWVNSTCAPKSICTGGACQSCTDACTLGAAQCASNGHPEVCVTGTGAGCTVWFDEGACSNGELCGGAGQCNSCKACTAGATQCTATGIETCTAQTNGCTAWVAKPCSSGSVCQNGVCATCNSTCTAGSKRCNGKGVETCTADTSGCTAWTATTTCTDFCSGGACGTCGTACKPGDNKCEGTGVETCITDAHNCPAWGPPQQCAPNSYCTGAGLCMECGASCTQGAMRCVANGGTEECELDTHGCTGWVAGANCGVGSGDHCTDGVCCHDACALGALQCSATGLPQVCITGASTCTEWKLQTACSNTQLCIDGTCRGACADDEFHSCADGTVCTGTSDGGFCLPGDAGIIIAPTFDAGITTGTGGGAGANGQDAGSGPSSLGASAGCGCSSFEGGALPLLGLALLSLRRRRAAQR